MEMYLARVSVRRVEDITEALWARVSPGTVSNLNKKIHAQACARAGPEYRGLVEQADRG